MTIDQLKAEAAKLPASDRVALAEWLSQGGDLRAFKHEELIREIRAGVDEADRGELIDADTVFSRLRAQLPATR